MGYSTALDIADTDISMEQQIAWHLQGNHYPPVPTSMVQPCIDAINAYWNDDYNAEIEMPEGVTYKGMDYAPAWAIIDQHHLHAWLDTEDEECYDD